MKKATKMSLAAMGIGAIALGALATALYTMARGLEDFNLEGAFDDDDELFEPGFLIEF